MAKFAEKIRSQSPQSGRTITDKGTLINVADLLSNSFTSFNQLSTAEESQQFVWKSVFPVSDLRDELTETNNGTVTSTGAGEIKLSVTSDSGSVAQIRTRQRGDYIPGSIFTPGLGFRLSVLPTSAKVEWGYFDNDGGIFFRYDSDGLSVVRKRSGAEDVVSQSAWNIDRLDGSDNINTNPSGLSLDLTEGHVYRMPFLYYGYGYCLFQIGLFDRFGVKHNITPVHVFTVEGETALSDSNLPLTARVDGNGEALDAYVGGRQMSTLGQDLKTFRTVSAVRKEATVNDTDWYPMVSVQEKTAFKNVFSQIGGIEVLTDANLEYAVFRNGTLTGDTFGTAPDYNSSETATQWDVSATEITGGELIAGPFLASGTRQQAITSKESLPDLPLLNGDTYTFVARRLSGTTATVSLTAKIKENW
jgi:hypothetical protein